MLCRGAIVASVVFPQKEVPWHHSPPWSGTIGYHLLGLLTGPAGRQDWLCSRRAFFRNVYVVDEQGVALATWSITGHPFKLRDDYDYEQMGWHLALCWFLASMKAWEGD